MTDATAPLTGPATHGSYRATRHFGSLDGLRFICITAVIWHHTPLWLEYRDTVILAARGHTGVDFFFVLSGFLITTLLLREEAETGRFSLRAFYWRRFLRIFPVYYFVVTAAAVLTAFTQNSTDHFALLPYYYAFLSNFLAAPDIALLSPTWSLAMEEQFYLLWPTLLLFLPRAWIVPVLALLIAVNVASAMDLFALIGIEGIHVGLLYLSNGGVTYAPLLIGALLAIMLHSRAGYDALSPVLTFVGAPVVWFITLLLALSYLPPTLEGWPNLVLHSVMAMTLGSLVAREDHAAAPLMKLRPIERIGQISYGIYLYHLFSLSVVFAAFEALGWSNLLLLMVTYYAIAIVISEISFRTLEAWPMRLRKRGWGRLGGLGAR